MPLLTIQHVLASVRRVFVKYPVARGMVAYSILWPSSNLVEQLVIARRDKVDLVEVLRYGLYGGLYSAPLVYHWMRFISRVLPERTLRTSLMKAAVEQVVYSPFALTTFYFAMNFLEGKDLDTAVAEWKAKFLPTYKSGLCYWPVVQTFNFTFVPERNRATFVAMFSFIWATYLSYMKQREVKHKSSISESPIRTQK